ncbi:MAG: GtrA family protein [Chloroflexota bacterium]|nr:GtrA family protein [Chloroflexota bacterium]
MAVRTIKIRNPLDAPILAIANRFGDKSKEVERFIKFALVGAFGFVVDFTTVFVLQATILPPKPGVPDFNVMIASTCGFVAAILSNFTWNRLWTYPDSRSKSMRRQLFYFALINVVGWVFRTLWITLAHEPIGEILLPLLLPEIQLFRPGYVPGPAAAAKLGTMFCLVTGVVVVMVWNFLANRKLTYNDVN